MKKILVCLLLIPCVASAEFWTGNKLYNNMKSTNNMDQVQAYGYVMGVFDTSAGVEHCGQAAQNVTVGQINDIAMQYLEQNPAQRNLAADLLVRVAFSRVWPCPKTNKRDKGV